MNLSTPITALPRVGPEYEKRLKKLGIATVRDLLFHFPRAYEDLSHLTPLAEVIEGNTWCIRGTIAEITEERTYKKRMSLIHALIKDDTGTARILWFNQPYLKDSLQQNDTVIIAGKLVRDKRGVYFSNPAYEKERGFPLVHTGRIVPLYPETTGVTSKWIRSLVFMALEKLPDSLPETLPKEILAQQNFLPLKQALREIHFPSSTESAEHAKRRFSFEELFSIMLFIMSERKKIASVKAPSVPLDPNVMQRFTKKLPFQLTDSQKKAAWHILKDMEKPRPMNRLLQGDVGSGKTAVATMAALSAAKGGWQTAFMAPTEILAQQHFKTIGMLLAPFRIPIGLLTGKTDLFISPKLPHDPIEISRKKLLERVKKGEIPVLIGTHALIQKEVIFGKLALLVLDEQHRFGIKQRAKLLHDGTLIPHLLSMTATPIPRTLAMTIYGDLDLTLITELPKGRKKIETRIIPPDKRDETYEFIRSQAKAGRQIFVICPRIEEAEPKDPEAGELKSVKAEYEKLSKDIFPDLRIAMLHGKMPQKTKEEVMRKFKFGKADILVSTSVVEVGVDIPNATVMMIEGAERFGLAQLHQFRGRVGRSDFQSYCFLCTESNTAKAKQRLKALEKTDSGFTLAEEDLRLRGPGDFSGVKQWGVPDFAMEQLANLPLVEQTRQTAKEILEQDIALKAHPELRERIQELRARLHLE